MHWKHLGIISNQKSLLSSHSQLPTPFLDQDTLSIYYASRNELGHSCICRIKGKIEGDNFHQIDNDLQLLNPGEMGYFDDHGIYPSTLIRHQSDLYLYYIGWNPSSTPPIFYASIGLAISTDNGNTFKKLQKTPVLGRSEFDPWMVTSPHVLKEGDLWRMWYTSGIGWEKQGGKWHSKYHIKYAESSNGIDWKQEGKIAVDLEDGEYNTARPWVLKGKDHYVMLFCKTQGDQYALGMATSKDGLTWIRCDSQLLVERSPEGIDSLAQSYPAVFNQNHCRYLLYNGNNFGKEGILLAKEIQS